MALLQVRTLSKSFGAVPVLDDFNLDVTAGDVVALTGPNGSGKTTALRCITGVDRPDTGTVQLAGRPFDQTRPQTRRQVCALLDDLAWFPDLTVREHLAVHAHAHGAPAGGVDDAITALGLTRTADQLPGTLSSGQTRRFALAQLLVRPWELAVLDEPEQNLDVAGRAWLGDYLRARADEGGTVLMASHDPELCARTRARRVDVTEAA